MFSTKLKFINNVLFYLKSNVKNNFKNHNPKVVDNCKRICTYPCLSAKIFKDVENNYAHQILRSDSSNYLLYKPIDTIKNVEHEIINAICVDKDLFVKTNEKLLEDFEKIAQFCRNTNLCISDDRFVRFVDDFTEKCSNFSDEELLKALKILAILPETESINSKNYVELWSVLDNVCTSRLKNYNLKQILLMCDHWYSLHLGKICKFIWESTKRIEKKITKLTPKQLVQTMFYVNLSRKPIIEIFPLEVSFLDSIDRLSLDEISIMSMGFFKTQTPIRNEILIDQIYERLYKETTTVQDITLVNILKILRYSSRLRQESWIKKLLDKLVPEISRISLLACLHVALLGTDIQCCHPESLEKIIERFIKEINVARIKDIERIVFVLGLYDFKTKDHKEKTLFELILKEIPNRVNEITRHPKCLPSSLHYLTLNNYYSEELMSYVLDNNFFKFAYGTNMRLGRDIFCLDSYARINLKDSYTGNLLSDKKRQTFGRLLSNYIPYNGQAHSLSATDKILLEVDEVCKKLYQYTKITHILPHFERADIVLAIDIRTKKAIDLTDNFPKNYSGDILTKEYLLKDKNLNENIKLIALIIGGWNVLIRNENRPTGLLKLKLNQMLLIGYNPVLIHWFDWRKLNESQKIRFMQEKINKVIQDVN